jgi:hypothetical protein
MKRFVIFMIVVCITKSGWAQLINVDLWKLRNEWGFWQFERANTARFAFYMGRLQKRSILLMNLARQDGAKFTSLVIEPYIDKNPKWDQYYISLYGADAPMLLPSFRLWLSALFHSVPSGIGGYSGHQGFDLRMNIFGNYSSPTGENCSYGHFRAMNVVLQLLNSSPHRANILEEDYSRVAVSKFLHVKEGWNSVTTFSGPKYYDLVFRNHNQLKHLQANVSVATDFEKPILDISIGMRHFNEVSAARWALGTEIFMLQNKLNILPKLHWSNETKLIGIGGNLMYNKDSLGSHQVIIRPELSLRIPYSISRKRGSTSFEYLNLKRSKSSIGFSLGYNLSLLKKGQNPYSPFVFSLTYTKNFLFFKNKNRR